MPTTSDPNGVLASLPASYRAAYAGIPAILASKWANWKPTHKGPYRVALVTPQLDNDYVTSFVNTLKSRIQQDPSVGAVSLSSTTGENIPQQVQEFNSAILSKPDLIVVFPIVPDALAPGINRAAQLGIPVVTASGYVPLPTAINVDINSYKGAAEVTARMVQSIGAKGNVLLVHGIAGTTPDNQRIAAAKAVIARCPNIKIAGQIFGDFSTSATKAAMLTYLATHPQPLAGIMTSGSMTVGSIQALKQNGRPVPFITGLTEMKGELGYWRQNRSSYHSAGTIQGGTAYGSAVALIALKTLHGQGPKTNMFTNNLPLVTDQNLDAVSNASWSLATPGFVDAPANSFMTDAYLNGLFKHGQPLK